MAGAESSSTKSLFPNPKPGHIRKARTHWWDRPLTLMDGNHPCIHPSRGWGLAECRGNPSCRLHAVPFLRCTFFPRLLCASLLSPLSIAVSRAFLVLFNNPGACWLWFGLVWFASFQAFFTSTQRVFFFRYFSHFQIFFLCSWRL